MKGDKRLIGTLNSLLADELTAINQYMVHSEMCDDWGYGKLHELIEKRAIVEMKHAERLIGRILFLEGAPVVSTLGPIKIGRDVPKMAANDLAAEYAAIKAYNAAVKLATQVSDNATKHMLEDILKDEDDHANDIEELQEQIEQMTLPIFLTTQTG